jgi:hypothetical protein
MTRYAGTHHTTSYYSNLPDRPVHGKNLDNEVIEKSG